MSSEGLTVVNKPAFYAFWDGNWWNDMPDLLYKKVMVGVMVVAFFVGMFDIFMVTSKQPDEKYVVQKLGVSTSVVDYASMLWFVGVCFTTLVLGCSKGGCRFY